MKTTLQRYTFVPGAANTGTLTLKDFNAPLSRVLTVFNATRGVLIYSPVSVATAAHSYTQAANSVITLKVDTSAHNAADSLIVQVDDGQDHVTVMLHNHVMDAFGRIKASMPNYRFDSQLTYQIDADLWDTKVTGTGAITHDAAARRAVMSTTANGDTAILQSHYHSPYTPGRSQACFVTFNFGAATSGKTCKVGYSDGSNGIMLQRAGSAVELLIQSTTGTGGETVAQADWNVDRLDGTGKSGITLDLTKTQILVIQLQALYVGLVVVGFDIGGEIVPVHAFNHANTFTLPYIAQASLPVRYEISQAGATAATMYAQCATVMSEGDNDLFEVAGRNFVAHTGATSVSVTTARPIISIRPKATLNGITSNILCIPVGYDVLARTNDCVIQVIRNGTLTGASFSDVDPLSGVQKDTSATAISGGTVIDMTIVSATTNQRAPIQPDVREKCILVYSHLLNLGDTLSVVATTRASGSSDVHAGIKWKEIR